MNDTSRGMIPASPIPEPKPRVSADWRETIGISIFLIVFAILMIGA